MNSLWRQHKLAVVAAHLRRFSFEELSLAMWTPALLRELRNSCGGTRWGIGGTVALKIFCCNLVVAIHCNWGTIQQTGESFKTSDGVGRTKDLRQHELVDATVADEISVDFRSASVLAQEPVVCMGVVGHRPLNHIPIACFPPWPQLHCITMAHLEALPNHVLARSLAVWTRGAPRRRSTGGAS